MKSQATTLWYTEVGTPHETHQFAVEAVLFAGRTKFQNVSILETFEYGKMLIIDDRTQSAEEDEYIYHESLVHPALLAHPAPRSVLIIGGGEGATAREVFRHPSIESVVMVDIDQELVEQCVKLLPEWHKGAFEDPRLSLVFADGKDFVNTTNRRFDVVIIDVCDVLEDGPALALYTQRFYHTVSQRLNSNGILVVQAMELSGLDHSDHATVHRTLRYVFDNVRSYATFIPSFWASWGFVIASDAVDVGTMSPQTVQERLAQREITTLRHYDAEAHLHMFALPKDVRAALNRETRAPA